MELFFGKNIKHLILILGKKDMDFAADMGVDAGTVSRWQANSVPRTKGMGSLVSKLGISSEMLLYEDLTKKWPSIDDFNNWKERETAARTLVDANQETGKNASIWLEVIVEYLAAYISKEQGRDEAEVRNEIDELYSIRFAAFQSLLKETSFDETAAVEA